MSAMSTRTNDRRFPRPVDQVATPLTQRACRGRHAISHRASRRIQHQPLPFPLLQLQLQERV